MYNGSAYQRARCLSLEVWRSWQMAGGRWQNKTMTVDSYRERVLKLKDDLDEKVRKL